MRHLPEKPGEYRIFIFNPETDYALASGRTLYNVPARVAEVRRNHALLPCVFASSGDAILLLDDSSLLPSPAPEIEAILKEKKTDIISLRSLPDYLAAREKNEERALLTPWGWNHTILNILMSAGADSRLLPSPEKIDKIRMLSHRRTAGKINDTLSLLLPGLDTAPALEFFSSEEAMDYFRSSSIPLFLKAPWSSSGRGVMSTEGVNSAAIEKWIAGCIRRQGSVMIEKKRSKTADFATEWWIDEWSTPVFLGFSMFKASAAGRYLGNSDVSQEEIEKELKNCFPAWDSTVIEAQKEALRHHISPFYTGPAGIDMLTTEEHSLRACVEVNLRFTMGMAQLFKPVPGHIVG